MINSIGKVDIVCHRNNPLPPKVKIIENMVQGAMLIPVVRLQVRPWAVVVAELPLLAPQINHREVMVLGLVKHQCVIAWDIKHHRKETVTLSTME